MTRIDGPYNTGPRPWNPATEAWPGGPHPGQIAQMQAQQDAMHAAAMAAAAERERTAFLLLLGGGDGGAS